MPYIDEILNEREKTHGDFGTGATLIQALKTTMRAHVGWDRLSKQEQESLETIQVKVARIINGSAGHKDNWIDIRGYANLIIEVDLF